MERPPTTERPAFRALEVHRVDSGPDTGIVLIDPLGLVDGQVFIPSVLLPIVGRFDGRRTIAEIAREAAAATGQDVSVTEVAELVRQLDDGLLLWSPQFTASLDSSARAFAALGTRPARHSGSAGYPRTAAECRRALDSLLGAPDRERRSGPLRGLIAPHIDLLRGSAGYAAAYRRLRAAPRADLYVVFGTGHRGPSAPVTGLALDWQTPVGTLRTDRGFVDCVHRQIGGPDPHDVFLHRIEHSVEFQMLFLAHVLGAESIEVAGFLTGALPSASGDPLSEAYCEALVAAFLSAAARTGKRVCWIAGADLAHVGPFFGDPAAVDQARLTRLASVERAHLALLERGDPGAFHRAVEADGNPDRVCGAAPILLTAALCGGSAEVLHYGQACAPDGSQVVSFCSAAYGG
jgi:hypothetical protein